MAILCLPIHVFAENIDLAKYNKMNTEETLKAENITTDLSNYSENDKQITIYMFRGQGCSHCQDFLNYVVSTLIPQYGNYFKLVSFETWKDSNNAKLLQTVANFLGDQAGGVPYIIIGDQTFLGYGETLNSGIESAITKEYNSKKRYDVFEEINKAEKKSNDENTAALIIGNVIITTIGVVIVIWHNNHTKKEIINSLSKKTTKKEKE